MKDLETQYSVIFAKFVSAIGKEYLALLREAMAEEGYNDPARRNGMNMKNFSDRIAEIRKKMKGKKLFKNIFSAMESVFTTIDRRAVKGIEKAYQLRKFPFSREAVLANVPSGLKDAIAENVELIKGIVDKQSQLLERAVLEAVKGGSSYKAVQKAVEAQTDKGKSYAKFVAADQVAKAYGAINQQRQETAGIPGYIWQSMNDSKTRHTHRRPSGKFFLWGKTMPNDTRPRDKNGKILNPGEDYRCRCEAIPAFDPSDAQLFSKNKFDRAEPNA